MDESNYVTVVLKKPMGIVFEENDSDYGGIFVQSLKDGSVAATDGTLQVGDQLVAVNTEKVSGMPFDDALGTIVDSEGDATKLVLFRGSAKQFYGPTGAGQAWLDEFVAKGGAETASSTTPDAAESKASFDVSIPYDAAARLAYEASGSKGDYSEFKAKYEADAVADAIAKRKA